MKKTLAFILAVLMLGLLCGCGGSFSNSSLAVEPPSGNETDTTTSNSNQTTKQSASAPKSPGLKVVEGKVELSDLGNWFTCSFKMKNTSGVTITKMFVFFVVLDKDGNILNEDQAPGSVRVAPGQSITVDKITDLRDDAYSVIVDHYSYYVGDDDYTEYVDDSPVIMIP